MWQNLRLYINLGWLPHFNFIIGLPSTGSWQDLKDHMREAGDVCYADVHKDGTGVVEFLRHEDMKYAVKKLDDSRFRSHEVTFCLHFLKIICMFVVMVCICSALKFGNSFYIGKVFNIAYKNSLLHGFLLQSIRNLLGPKCSDRPGSIWWYDFQM